jgi:hypothetical protein
MAHDQNYLGSGQFACELHTAQYVSVFDISRDATVEDIADAEVHDRLSRRARVNAGK